MAVATPSGSFPSPSVAMMPIWIDDTHIDPAWIRHRTGLPCTNCLVEDISNETRRGNRVRDGATLKLSLTLDGASSSSSSTNSRSLSLIIKQVPEHSQLRSRQLGLAREALFYNHLAADVEALAGDQQDRSNDMIPKIWYAHGDMATGEKVVIMEDLSPEAVDSGVFFGPGNPNNWKRDLKAMVAQAGPKPPLASTVAKATFRDLARVHATFWCRSDLLSEDKNWMRGQEWLQGKGKDTWEASQNLVQRFWKTCLSREESSGKPSIQWDPLVRQAIERSIVGISWEAQLKRLNIQGRWTVVHGDCWPGNFMWMINNTKAFSHCEEGNVKLLDWEMVGIGSGPQDLGQYVLSNMDPVERIACEKDLILTYYEELKKCGVEDVDWDYCWSEYKLGGVERWLWFLIYFLGQEGEMLEWAQFFHNQIASFMIDHEISASEIVQPRP